MVPLCGLSLCDVNNRLMLHFEPLFVPMTRLVYQCVPTVQIDRSPARFFIEHAVPMRHLSISASRAQN